MLTVLVSSAIRFHDVSTALPSNATNVLSTSITLCVPVPAVVMSKGISAALNSDSLNSVSEILMIYNLWSRLSGSGRIPVVIA